MRKQKNILKMAAVVIGFIGLCSFVAVTWETYSNKYISFKYPDTYKIVDEEMTEEGCSLSCEIKGYRNTLSMVRIDIVVFEDEWDDSTKETAILKALSRLEDNMKDDDLEYYETYQNVVCSKTKAAKKGKISGYSRTFTATLVGTPMQGEDFLAFSGNKLLALFLSADNATHMDQLNQIVSGIEFK